MTLNREMALIYRLYMLRYFKEFDSFRGTFRNKWLTKPYNYGQFTITTASSKRLQKDVPRDSHGINIL